MWDISTDMRDSFLILTAGESGIKQTNHHHNNQPEICQALSKHSTRTNMGKSL